MQPIDWDKRLQEIQKRIRENSSISTQTKKYSCNKCKDHEYILITQDGYTKAIPCECKAIKDLERLIKNSGLSDTFLEKNFGNFLENKKNNAIKQICMQYVSERCYLTDSIFIAGNVGSGKTHLAMAIANNLLHKNISVIYIDYRIFMTNIKQLMLDRDEYYRQMETMRNADILLIDDLYKGKITPTDINVMFEIINTRYLAKKQMIITSELPISAILEIDEGLGSRIYEMAKNFTLLSEDENHRLMR